MANLYEPDHFFERLDDLHLRGRLGRENVLRRYWQRHPWYRRRAYVVHFIQFAVLFLRLMRGVADTEPRRQYRERIWRVVWLRRDPFLTFHYTIECVMHYHFYRMVKEVRCGQLELKI